MANSAARWLPLLVAVVTIAVFARLVACDFTAWDDPSTIRDNPKLRPPTPSAVAFYWTTIGRDTPGQLFTPVTYTVWEAVAAVAGVRAWAFHGTNVLLHATAAALAFGLLRQLFGRPSTGSWPAAAGALLFAVHPAQVESVGWASGTKDVLCGLFAIAALSAYVAAVRSAARGRRRRLYLLATSLYLLAMLAKPTALVVPLMAFTIDALLLDRPWPTAARCLWPWAVLMVPCVLWTRAAQPAPWASPVPAWTRPLIAADAVAFDLAKVAWPAHLGVDYGRRPVAVVASGVIYWTWVLPAAVAAVLAWRRWRPLTAAAVLFVLPVVPVSGLVPFDFQFYSTVSDHYLYLPLLGAAVAATWGLTRFAGRTPAKPGANGGVAIAAVVLVALGARSAVQAPVWQDTFTLFRHGLDVNDRSFVSCEMLGYVDAQAAKRARGDRSRMMPADAGYADWRAALERSQAWYRQSLDRYAGYVPAYVNLAINAAQLGRADEQRAALRQVVALQPTLPEAMRADPVELVRRLLAAGDSAAALAYLDAQARAHPGDVRFLAMRADVDRAARGATGKE